MMLDAAHAFCEQATESWFQAKWIYTGFGKISHGISKEQSTVFKAISNTIPLRITGFMDFARRLEL
jgi:hypothetical protein